MSNLTYSPFATRTRAARPYAARPFSGLLARDAARLLDEATSGPERRAWTPGVDIHEEETAFRVLADLPGVDMSDVDVTLDGNILTIRGSRETTSETEHAGVRRRERASGSFERRFSLPDTADADAITARANNGVLEVVIPKKEQVLPRSIAIEA